MKKTQFFKGITHGIPIFLGYISVSFGFGIMAVRSGLSILEATAISFFNLTSAGQAAGIGIIAANGSIAEMITAQFTINLRYSLMSLSLSQKLDSHFGTARRLLVSYGITDEIFAVAAAQPGSVTPWYMYGMILISTVGWCLGTFLGAAAGNILPAEVSDALGILLYGMFLAIIIPPSRREKSVLAAVAAAAVISTLIYYLLPFISGGFAIIISAVAAACAAALIFPRKDEEETEE